VSLVVASFAAILYATFWYKYLRSHDNAPSYYGENPELIEANTYTCFPAEVQHVRRRRSECGVHLFTLDRPSVEGFHAIISYRRLAADLVLCRWRQLERSRRAGRYRSVARDQKREGRQAQICSREYRRGEQKRGSVDGTL